MDRHFHLVFVSLFYPPEGTGVGTYIQQTARMAAEQGCRVSIITKNPHSKDKREEIIDCGSEKVYLYRVPVKKLLPGLTYLYWQKRVVSLIMKINRVTPIDIIEFPSHHYEGLYYSLLPFRKIPYVVRLHGAKERLFDFRKFIGFKEKVREFFCWIMMRGALKLVAVSLSTAGTISEFMGIPQKRIAVLHAGIDTQLFSPQENNISREERFRDKTIILFVGRMTKGKGVPMLVDAFLNEIKPFYPNTVLLLIGPKGGAYTTHFEKREMEKVMAKIEKERDIFYLGPKPPEALSYYYSGAYLFVSPSEWEGSPITLREALACGVPVITTSVGGSPEIVQQEKNGLLIPDNRPKEIGHAIKKLLQNPSLRNRLAANARRSILENFSLQVCTSRQIEFYQKLLSFREKRER